ncbi:MAG TPA: hypothetical protein VLB44_01185 [Kofleriaceae bacterium]|nr:hypothetical protein [Kofleriaceae bacterium]
MQVILLWSIAVGLGLLGWVAIVVVIGKIGATLLALAGIGGICALFNWIATGDPLARGPH